MIALWVASALAGAAWGFAESFTPAPPPASEQNYKAAEQSGDKSEPEETLWRPSTWGAITFFTFWVAVFTLALAVSTTGLWIINIRSARRQLRAYIGPYSMEVEVFRYEEGGWVAMAHTELRNFGQTPAYDLTSSSWAGIHKADAIPFNDESDPAVEDMPKAGIAFRDAGFHLRIAVRLSDEQVAALRDREHIIFFWGRVTYRDAFGKARYLFFRMVSQERTTDPGEIYRMGPHPLGYEAN